MRQPSVHNDRRNYLLTCTAWGEKLEAARDKIISWGSFRAHARDDFPLRLPQTLLSNAEHLMAAAEPIGSSIRHCGHLLSGLDPVSAAREYEIRRVPESLEPSGNQPILDVQELGELLVPA